MRRWRAVSRCSSCAARPGEEWPGFQEAIQDEVQSMTKHYEALAPVPIEENEEIWSKRADRTFSSIYHFRRKPVYTEWGGVGFKPECR